jgi:signal peptidase II
MPSNSILRTHLSRFRFYYVALLVILVDQAVKFAVKFNMLENESINVVGDTFKIHHIENRGAAFGLTVADIGNSLGVELSEDSAKLILTMFSLLAVVGIVYFLRKSSRHRSPLPYLVALILGGALGNIVDRVFYGTWFHGINSYSEGLLHGRVVDMFFLDLGKFELLGNQMELWPVFNVADAAISIGIVSIIFLQGYFLRVHRRNVIKAGLDPDEDPVLIRMKPKPKGEAPSQQTAGKAVTQDTNEASS